MTNVTLSDTVPVVGAKVSGSVSLGSTSKQTIGRNKSGKAWKKESVRSQMCKSIRKSNFEIRKAQVANAKELQARTKEVKRRVFE